jgi:hypothetical protein
MRLLAKTADERYQTGSGVQTDLRRCLAEWEAYRQMGTAARSVSHGAGGYQSVKRAVLISRSNLGPNDLARHTRIVVLARVA